MPNLSDNLLASLFGGNVSTRSLELLLRNQRTRDDLANQLLGPAFQRGGGDFFATRRPSGGDVFAGRQDFFSRRSEDDFFGRRGQDFFDRRRGV